MEATPIVKASRDTDNEGSSILDKVFYDFQTAPVGCKHEAVLVPVIERINISAAVQEQFYNLKMPILTCPHQRGVLRFVVVADIYGHSSDQKQFHNVEISVLDVLEK